MTLVRTSQLAVVALWAAAATSANAQLAYHINLTDDAGGATVIQSADVSATITAAHEDGLSQSLSTWNNLSLSAPAAEAGVTPIDPLFGTSLIDAANGAAGPTLLYSQGDTNVDFDAAVISASRDAGNPGPDAGTDGNVIYEDVWFARPEEFAQAFNISSLPADRYAVYVYHNDSTQNDRSYTLSFATDNDFVSSMIDGTIVTAINGSDTDAFVDGLNYTRFDIDVAASENLVFFVSATENTGDPNEEPGFPSIGAVQIVSTGLLPTIGDVNGDDLVTIADFEDIRDNYFSDGTNGGEAVGAIDGRVDIQDFVIWKREFERAGGNASGLSLSVPEPSACALLSLGAIVLTARLGRHAAA